MFKYFKLKLALIAVLVTLIFQYWPEPGVDIESGQLDNGLRYYLYDSDNPEDGFNIRVLVDAGGVDELGTPGVAHMVEHMVFNSTEKYPSIHKYLEAIGWKAGRQVNASTNSVRTQYMIRAKKDDALDLYASLDLLHQMLAKARMTTHEFELERKIITSEWRQVVDRDRRRGYRTNKILMANSKFAGRTTIGGYEAIQAARLNELKAFYKRWYVARNMQVIISGNIDTASAKKYLKLLYGTMPDRRVPQRDYRKVALAAGLTAGTLQSPETRISRVTFGLRFALPKAGTEAGERARTNQFLTLQTIRAMLQDQQRGGDKPIRIRQRELTLDQSSWLFEIDTEEHDQGLRRLLTLVEKLRRQGLDEKIVGQQLELLRKKTEAALQKPPGRHYAQIENQLNDALTKQLEFRSEHQRNQALLNRLKGINKVELSQSMQDILQSPDLVLIYEAPEGVELSLPDAEGLQQIRQTISNGVIIQPKMHNQQLELPPLEKREIDEILLPAAGVSTYNYHSENSVHEWQLGNGDRVVWYETDAAGDELQLRLQTNVGLDNQQYPRWMMRAAFMLWQQSPLQGWQAEQWSDWQERHSIKWNWSEGSQSLRWSSKVEPQQLDLLLQLYQARTHWANISQAAFQKWQSQSLQRLRFGAGDLQATEQLVRLRFGKVPKSYVPASEAMIKALDRTELLKVVTQIARQPITLFISGAVDKSAIEMQVLARLGGLARQPTLIKVQPEKVTGIASMTVDITPAEVMATKADVLVESFAGVDVESGSGMKSRLLGMIVNERLRKYMRLEQGDVYTVSFNMWLNRDEQIASRLSFIAAPERVTELLTSISQLNGEVSDTITESELQRAKAKLSLQAKRRSRSTRAALNRLSLSYDKHNDPRLLEDNLAAEAVTLASLKQLARSVFPARNRITLITLKQ